MKNVHYFFVQIFVMVPSAFRFMTLSQHHPFQNKIPQPSFCGNHVRYPVHQPQEVKFKNNTTPERFLLTDRGFHKYKFDNLIYTTISRRDQLNSSPLVGFALNFVHNMTHVNFGAFLIQLFHQLVMKTTYIPPWDWHSMTTQNIVCQNETYTSLATVGMDWINCVLHIPRLHNNF